MFCPRCAAHNIDDARYCRVCGADISLLPQVLSGELNAELAEADDTAVDRKSKRKRKEREKEREKEKEKNKPPTFEKAYENIGVGISFILISIMIAIFMPGGRFWWFWMLIPALACAGEGVGQLMRVKREMALGALRAPHLPAAGVDESRHLPPQRNTTEIMMPPPSVTENTTRHLGVERPKSKAGAPADPSAGALDSDLK
jgi:hypothetical protein